MTRRWFTLPLAMTLVATPAYPCGGPGADIIDRPLVPVSDYLARVLYDDEYEHILRSQFRFLEPFHLGSPDSVATLYEWAYTTGVGVFTPDAPNDSVRQLHERELLVPAYDALARGAYDHAAAIARRGVDAVLDQPASPAAAYGEELRTAVEIVDLTPHLAPADGAVAARYFQAVTAVRPQATPEPLPPVLREALAVRSLPRDSAGIYATAHPESPRLGSLRFVALQEAMRSGIPDGYAFEIKDSVPPARWAELERLHDDWLRRFGAHPMADYVRLSKVRLFYFKGETDRAWNELLAMYPRHRQRVLGEMRYFVYLGVLPPSLDDPRIDWPLRAALLMEANLSSDQWNTYWRATETHSREAWALPMQERLLWRSIAMADSARALPAAFPKRAMAPSPLWAGLRLIALLQAGDIKAAFTQADSTPDSTLDVGAVRARLHLLGGEWGRAITALGENDPSTSYVIRVLAPRAVVDSLATNRTPFSTEARLTSAARLAAAGEWRAAAGVAAGTSADRARAWSRTAELAGDTSRAGTLAFARWMRAERGQLFFGENTEWMRALNWRRYALDPQALSVEGEARFDTRLPWTPREEREKIEQHLRATTELYYALQAYAKWLNGATAATPGLAAVIREADQVYNRLLNWDANNSPYWGQTLETSAEARAIRRAGSLLRTRR